MKNRGWNRAANAVGKTSKFLANSLGMPYDPISSMPYVEANTNRISSAAYETQHTPSPDLVDGSALGAILSP